MHRARLCEYYGSGQVGRSAHRTVRRYLYPIQRMPPLPIKYYGRPGLEQDVLLSYIRLSGYSIESVLSDSPAALPLSRSSGSIAIVSLPPDGPVIGLVQQIRRQERDCVKIFILGEGPEVPADLPNVEVIPRPAQLSTLMRRIRAFSRGDE